MQGLPRVRGPMRLSDSQSVVSVPWRPRFPVPERPSAPNGAMKSRAGKVAEAVRLRPRPPLHFRHTGGHALPSYHRAYQTLILELIVIRSFAIPAISSCEC